MTDIKVRNLDASVAAALRSRAEAKGVSLEEEVRRTPRGFGRGRSRRAGATGKGHAAAAGRPGKPELDSARIVRAEIDAWG